MINIDISKTLFGVDGEMELNISLSIPSRQFLIVTGPSGSGKTTLLRVVAGLEKSNGKIVVENEIWQDSNIFLPPQKRGIGFLFQSYALFPNMTILEHLLFVDSDIEFANYLLEITHLTKLKNRYPQYLSGGQKQRVALARALMKRPKLLLLDEPFSALDTNMRNHLQQEILSIHREFGTTTMMVTHNREEMEKMGDRYITIEHGKIVSDRTD